MPVENILVISTANLDPNTALSLSNGVHFGISDVFTREYGYVMFPAAIRAASDEGNAVPKCLTDAAEIAKLENAEILMFDCDADIDGRMSVYDW